VVDAFFVCLTIWLLARLITGLQTRMGLVLDRHRDGPVESDEGKNALVFVGSRCSGHSCGVTFHRMVFDPEYGSGGWVRTRIAAAGMSCSD